MQSALAAEMKKRGWDLTFTFGVSSYRSDIESAEEAISKADATMRAAKSAEGNVVHETYD
jgi:GGDEF domain-containing protein